MKYTHYILFLSFLVAGTINAQNNQTFDVGFYGVPNIQSPNATDLGKFGDIPVSLYTGRANISIPLYTLSVSGVNMPISLDYDTSGLLMNSLPGWTGHNWTLNVGGVITRAINGVQDELYRQIYQGVSTEGHFHHQVNLHGLIHGDSSAFDTADAYDIGVDIFTFNFMGYTGRFFLGNDGEWKVDSDANIDVIFDITDESNYIYPFIEGYPGANATNRKYMPKVIKGFILRDENGIIYEFGGNNNSIEFSIGFNAQTNTNEDYPWIANSWYLTKIKDKYGKTLYSLEYERGVYIAHIYRHLETTGAVLQRNHTTNTIHGCFLDVHNHQMPYNGDLISPVYLKKVIDCAGTIINFHSSYLAIGLDSLYGANSKSEVFGAKINELLEKKMQERPIGNSLANIDTGGNPLFDYPYYYLQDSRVNAPYQYNPSLSPEKKYLNPLGQCRLKQLDSISISSKDTTFFKFDLHYNLGKRMHLSDIYYKTVNNNQQIQLSKYSFSYYDFSKLPAYYLTPMVDHWGFFNGKKVQYESPQTIENGGSSIEDDYLPFTNRGDSPNPYIDGDIDDEQGKLSYNYAFTLSRQTDEWKMLYGMLKEITYPTGGRTIFEYESNDYAKIISDDRTSVIVDKTIDDFFEEEYNSAITNPLILPPGSNLDPLDSLEFPQLRSLCGGLRIKKITNYNRGGLVNSKEFSYINPLTGKSSGILFARPRYSWSWNFDDIYVSTFQDVSILPLSNRFGPHVGYSYVQEKTSAGNTLYHYQNIDDVLDLSADMNFNQNTFTPYTRFSERGYGRGHLLESWESDSTNFVVKHSIFEYDTLNVSNKFIYTSNGNNGVLYYLRENCPSITNSELNNLFLYGSIYRLYYPKYKITCQTDSVWNGIHWEVTRKEYSYVNNSVNISYPYPHVSDVCKPISIQTIISGDSILDNYQYSFYSDSISSQLTKKYFDLSPVRVTHTRNGTPSSIEQWLYGVKDNEIILQSIIKQKGNGVDTLLRINEYTNSFAVKRFTKQGEYPTLILWNESGTLPIAMIQGKREYLNPISSATNISQLRTNSALKISSYTYDLLGNLSSSTSPNGATTYYQYTMGNRLSERRNTFSQLIDKYIYHYHTGQ